MSQTDLASRLKEAINLINNGQRAEARPILLELSRQYPAVEQVWMWLATASDDTNERVTYLSRVLKINPDNERARTAYTRLVGSPPPRLERPREPVISAPPLRMNTSYIIPIIAIVAIALIVVIASFVVLPTLTPAPTPTPLPSQTSTQTPDVSPTPSITPGGPTLTPIIAATLPPTWTPSATFTDAPSSTPFKLPTFTPQPYKSPTKSFAEIPTLTAIPTITPGGPSLTPRPSRTPKNSEKTATAKAATQLAEETLTETPTP
jgi:hypothetical protein